MSASTTCDECGKTTHSGDRSWIKLSRRPPRETKLSPFSLDTWDVCSSDCAHAQIGKIVASRQALVTFPEG